MKSSILNGTPSDSSILLDSDELYEGKRIVGVFKRDECVGHVLINIYGPDAFDYDKAKTLGMAVLVV